MQQIARFVFVLILTTSLSMTSIAQDAAPASADTFEREALKALKASFAARRSVVIHTNGSTITGLVKAIGPDVIVLANREHETLVVRRERIDAIEAN